MIKNVRVFIFFYDIFISADLTFEETKMKEVETIVTLCANLR